jgi:hypothetical protein
MDKPETHGFVHSVSCLNTASVSGFFSHSRLPLQFSQRLFTRNAMSLIPARVYLYSIQMCMITFSNDLHTVLGILDTTVCATVCH